MDAIVPPTAKNKRQAAPAASDSPDGRSTHYRWVVCGLLFFATTINYVDRQVFGILGPKLTEEFHWTESRFQLHRQRLHAWPMPSATRRRAG